VRLPSSAIRTKVCIALNLSMADYSSINRNSHVHRAAFIDFEETNTMAAFFPRSLR
jgi:tetrahydrodipicolinate N-succinyltransferase